MGDGLSFAINGGDGADNNVSPDLIATGGNGIACLFYDTGQVAGVRLDENVYQTVFCGFSFEGIADDVSREGLMQNVVNWFTSGATGVASEVASALAVTAPIANPNPFNPSTNIEFEVLGNDPLPLQIEIYDLRGQLVRHLYRGVVSPGAQSYAWDGRTDDGAVLATGIYLARVGTGGLQQTVKMTLVK